MMGRTPQTRLEFMPVPVNLMDDIRTRSLIRSHGAQAITVYIALLAAIYSSGYYTELTDELIRKVAEQCNTNEVAVRKVIDSCTTVGLFDRGMLYGPKVLTSPEIQSAWLTAVSRRKVDIDEHSLLIGHMPAKVVEQPKIEEDIFRPSAPSQENIYNSMRTSWMWLESMAMNHHLSRDDILKYIDDFQLHCRCIEKIHDNTRTAKQHFNNWLYTQQRIDNEQSTKNKSGTQAYGREQRAAAYAAAIANLAAEDDSRAR